MSFLLRVCSSNFAHKFYHLFPELYQNSQHFWTFPNLASYSNHLNLNQINLNLILSIMPLLFFLDQAHFCNSGKIIPMPKFFATHFFSPLFFLCFSIFGRDLKEGERGREAQPRTQAGPFAPGGPAAAPI